MRELQRKQEDLDEVIDKTQTSIDELWSRDDQVQDFQNLYDSVMDLKRGKSDVPDVSDTVKDAVRKALQKQIAVAFFGTKTHLQCALNKLR